jgi:N-acyl-D-aspartate/D-glutamate deacylase
MIGRLRDPALRPRIAQAVRDGGFSPDDILLLSAIEPSVRRFLGKRLSEVARELGKAPEEALMDLVAEDRANVRVARFGMNEDDLQLALRQPYVAFDTDSGAVALDGPLAREGAHPRAYATTARILARYVRDLRLFSLEEAVRKMTSLPARRLGLWDRGLLRPGMYADLVVFDPEQVEDTATFEHPNEYPRGIDLVIVNGRIALEGGKRTSVRAGRPLLRPP